MGHLERDQEIGRLYEAGASLEQLAAQFGLSPSWIRDILKKQQRYIKYRDVNVSDREKFLGVNISAPVKKALKKEADRRGISMSSLTSDVLKDMLTELGYPVEASQVQGEVAP